MLVLSSIKVVSSTISCWTNCARTSSHTPAFVHARNRLYTLCQGPNLSGRSLQGIPVFSQYTMALSIYRLLFAGCPPCGFRSGGSKSLILFHCASLNSCLLIFMSLPYWHFAHNFWVLKRALGLSSDRLSGHIWSCRRGYLTRLAGHPYPVALVPCTIRYS